MEKMDDYGPDSRILYTRASLAKLIEKVLREGNRFGRVSGLSIAISAARDAAEKPAFRRLSGPQALRMLAEALEEAIDTASLSDPTQ